MSQTVESDSCDGNVGFWCRFPLSVTMRAVESSRWLFGGGGGVTVADGTGGPLGWLHAEAMESCRVRLRGEDDVTTSVIGICCLCWAHEGATLFGLFVGWEGTERKSDDLNFEYHTVRDFQFQRHYSVDFLLCAEQKKKKYKRWWFLGTLPQKSC